VIEMTGSEMVMKMLSGLLLGMLVGVPVLIWLVVLFGLVRRFARDLHERLLDHADERRRRKASRHVWVSVDDVLPGQRQPVSVDHSVLPGAHRSGRAARLPHVVLTALSCSRPGTRARTSTVRDTRGRVCCGGSCHPAAAAP